MSRILALQDGSVDLDRLRVRRGDREEGLTATEGALLAYLAERAQTDVPRAELLTEVWGYAASVVTRAIDKTMTRVRRKIEVDPTAPHHLVTVHGVGYRWVGPGLTAAAPTTRWTGFAQAFVGRSSEAAALLERVQGAALVSVVGPPGIGKSRLVREALPGLDPPVEVTWCRAPRGSDATVALASKLEVGVGVVPARLAALGGVLVLDHWGAEHAQAIWDWVKAAPGVRFVRTGHRPLGLADERVMRLDPLAPRASRRLLDELLAHHGVTDVDEPSMERALRACQGVPLALEMAAASARAGSLGVLQDTGRLHDAVQCALDELPDALRESLKLLACVGGPFELESARSILGDEALAVLSSLTERGLLERDAGQWRLLGPIRSVAVEGVPAELASRARALRVGWLAELLGPEPLLALWGPGHDTARTRLSEHAEAVLQLAGEPDAERLAPIADLASRWLGGPARPRPDPGTPEGQAAIRALGWQDAAADGVDVDLQAVATWVTRWPGLACSAYAVAGRVALRRDDLGAARGAWWRAMGLAEGAPDPRWQVRLVGRLGVLAGMGRRALVADAAAQAEALGEVAAAFRCRLAAAALAAIRGEAIRAPEPLVDGAPADHLALALLLADLGDRVAADASLERARVDAPAWLEAEVQVHLARHLLLDGDPAASWRRLAVADAWPLPPRARALCLGVQVEAAARLGVDGPQPHRPETSDWQAEVGLACCHFAHAALVGGHADEARTWLDQATATRSAESIRPLTPELRRLRAEF